MMTLLMFAKPSIVDVQRDAGMRKSGPTSIVQVTEYLVTRSYADYHMSMALAKRCVKYVIVKFFMADLQVVYPITSINLTCDAHVLQSLRTALHWKYFVSTFERLCTKLQQADASTTNKIAPRRSSTQISASARTAQQEATAVTAPASS